MIRLDIVVDVFYPNNVHRLPVENKNVLQILVKLTRSKVLLIVFTICQGLEVPVLNTLDKLKCSLTEEQCHRAEVLVHLQCYKCVSYQLALREFIVLSYCQVLVRFHEVDSARKD